MAVIRKLLAFLCCAASLFGARSYICGFEMGSNGEGIQGGNAAGLSIQSSVVRSGAYALQLNGSQNTTLDFQSLAAGGTGRTIFRSVRFYLRIGALPSSGVILWSLISGGVNQDRLILGTSGTLQVADSAGANAVTSSNTLSADGLWHRIELDVGWSGGSGRAVYVDGASWASSSATSAPATNGMRFNWSAAAANSVYIDDILVDDNSFTSSGFPGAGNVALLIPTAGNNANSWTGGGGGTGNISVGVDNIPPTGAATPADASQIKNAASGGNLDYIATMQTYTVGGVSGTVNAVMAIVNDAEEVGTNTKAGGIWIASNPAQGAGGNSFDYGDDVGAQGAFPSNWRTHAGPVSVAPSVTLGTAPTVTVRKTTSTTRVVDVDFMGLYVDYTPSAGGTVVKDVIQRGLIAAPR